MPPREQVSAAPNWHETVALSHIRSHRGTKSMVSLKSRLDTLNGYQATRRQPTPPTVKRLYEAQLPSPPKPKPQRAPQIKIPSPRQTAETVKSPRMKLTPGLCGCSPRIVLISPNTKLAAYYHDGIPGTAMTYFQP